VALNTIKETNKHQIKHSSLSSVNHSRLRSDYLLTPFHISHDFYTNDIVSVLNMTMWITIQRLWQNHVKICRFMTIYLFICITQLLKLTNYICWKPQIIIKSRHNTRFLHKRYSFGLKVILVYISIFFDSCYLILLLQRKGN
jgi:hypothetical protein